MKEKTFVVRIFDGTYTTFYTVKTEETADMAEYKIIGYHKALGGSVIKVTTTQI